MVIMPLRPWAKPLNFGAPKKENQLDTSPNDLEQARHNMIEQQIRPWDVLDPRVLETLQLVRREEFVPAEYRALAFTDMNVPLPHGQVMMSPKLEARLLQELALSSSDKVLEIADLDKAFPATTKREFLLWIATAKRAQTRADRVAASGAAIAEGRRLSER